MDAMSDPSASAALAPFSAPTREWFAAAFAAPTPAQAGAWAAIGAGRHALVVAPTGSGKTLSAFLWSIDRLLTAPPPEKQRRCRVLYVSPLKALAVDVERNLRAPLAGIGHTATRLGVEVPELRVGLRSGDTTASTPCSTDRPSASGCPRRCGRWRRSPASSAAPRRSRSSPRRPRRSGTCG
jgi:ATP-dependent Lhr-like helicase